MLPVLFNGQGIKAQHPIRDIAAIRFRPCSVTTYLGYHQPRVSKPEYFAYRNSDLCIECLENAKCLRLISFYALQWGVLGAHNEDILEYSDTPQQRGIQHLTDEGSRITQRRGISAAS